MIIKEKSLIAYYYRWMFCNRLAQDFCSLFWNTLFSIFLLPLTIPAFLASLVFGHDVWERNLLGKSFRGLLTYFGVILAFCFGLGFFEKIFGETWRTWDFWPIMGAALLGFVALVIAIIVVFGTIIGLCAGVYYSYHGIINSFHNKVVYKSIDEDGDEHENHYYEPKEYKIVVLWNTIRNKYCTKIEWK